MRLAAAGLLLGGLAFAHSYLAVAATVAIWTFGEMILLPTLANVVADLAPKHRTGVYMGLYSTSFSLAYATAPPEAVRENLG